MGFILRFIQQFLKRQISLDKLWKINGQAVVVAHTFNPITQEAEAGGSLSLRPAWSMELVPEQPELYRETLSQKTNK